MGLNFRENPPETSENYSDLSAILSPWVVVQTNARCEKKLAFLLHDRYPEIPYFLPLVARISSSRNISVSPLFPGFVFVAASPESEGEKPFLEQKVKDLCVSTGFVWGFITANDQTRLRKELAFLATTALTQRDKRDNFPPGKRVRIRSGPLMGLEGIVSDKDKNRITIKLEVLGQYVSTVFEGIFPLELV